MSLFPTSVDYYCLTQSDCLQDAGLKGDLGNQLIDEKVSTYRDTSERRRKKSLLEGGGTFLQTKTVDPCLAVGTQAITTLCEQDGGLLM